MSYQFIVISACEKRKQTMIEMFKELDISDNLIYYLQASTPENSAEYFVDASFVEENEKKVICCAKSHFRAIEYAASHESPEYSIILEDDAAFHKTDFIKITEEIISVWQQNFKYCHYISLGWVPCRNYNHFETRENKIKIQSISDINNKYVFYNTFYTPGTQCYIVKKNKINEFSQILNKPTFVLFKESIRNFMDNKYGTDFEDFCYLSIDILLNRMMLFRVLFPPLVIEQKNTESLLEHTNHIDIWNNFFNGYEEEIKNYMTY